MVGGLSPPRRTLSMGSGSAMGRRAAAAAAAATSDSPKPGLSRSMTMGGERTVKRLRLSRALTVPESTTVLEVCRRMAARRADAALLTDSNALLCGILTDKDIATRVIARELKIDETPVWKVMTRHPIFVISDTLAVEALQKMVQGKFRHLPVVDNGEVVAMLDIAKCLYDAIARMERASEKGKAAIANVADGDDKYSIVEAFKEQMFRPCLSAIASADSTVVMVSPGDSVLTATKKMVEGHASSVVVAVGSKAQGILTSRDILMRVIAKNLSSDSTPVEKVMTPDPECATVDTPILDALRTMQERKFLHLPVMDRDGFIISILDVIDITHAAISIVESSGDGNDDVAASMIQRFWDSAMALSPLDDETDTQSQMSEVSRSQMMSDVHHESAVGSEAAYPLSFSFKLQDRRGRMHRFSCEIQSLTPLVTCILRRLGSDIDPDHLPQILGLKLFLDYSGTTGSRKAVASSGGAMAMGMSSRDAWAAAYSGVAAGAALVTGIGVLAYLRRSG
ncbi:CBS domain-containing protein CBSCBSPB5 [Dichanthelium oligosanthes]|uniref:CBS domain-containing protein CBSCBSPB5 n=1 Tax=Dichanthelium oligosanthes TaxID=888268 RepID=A0A1E5UQ81_9POAL|nr:CBS domain-containing protein CBSCBSPB5 [Dichanthelium oligosanthes]